MDKDKKDRENMELECLQEEPKLILTYPHKSNFNRIGCLSMVVLSLIVMWVLNHLMSYHTAIFLKSVILRAIISKSFLIRSSYISCYHKGAD